MDHLRDPLFSTISEREYPIQELVKQASDSTPTMFAYFNGIEHFFPISTANEAALSSIYFEKNAHLVPEKYRGEVASSINDACMVFDVKIERNIEKIATQEDAVDAFLLDLSRFERFGPEISYVEKRASAENLIKRACEFDSAIQEQLHLPEKVKRYAGSNLSHDWKKHIEARIRMAPHDDAREHYRAMLNDEHQTERADPMQLAKLVGFLDKRYMLRDHYNKTLSDPFYSMMSSEPKKAHRVVIVKLGGRDIHEADLDGLTRDHLGVFGDHITDQIMERRDMESLPEHVKDLLAGILNAVAR